MFILMKSGCKHVNNRVMQHKQGTIRRQLTQLKTDVKTPIRDQLIGSKTPDVIVPFKMGRVPFLSVHPDTSWLTAAALRLCVRAGLTVSPLPIGTGAALYCLHAPPGGPAHRRATSNQRAERRRGRSSATMLPSAGVGISHTPAVRERLCRKMWKNFIYKNKIKKHTCWNKDVQSGNGSWEEVRKNKQNWIKMG